MPLTEKIGSPTRMAWLLGVRQVPAKDLDLESRAQARYNSILGETLSYVFDLLETHCSTQYLGQPIQWNSPEQLSPLKAVRAYRHVSGHWHFVSYGLRDLGKDFELSLRVAGAETPPPQWPIALLKQLASYARQSKLDSGHKISGVGPLVPSLRDSSAFACLALILDTVSNSMEVPTEEFRILQAVGLTTEEYEACVSWETLAVLNLWKKSNPLLLCSFERPSFLTDPAIKKTVQDGIATEGSSQLTTMTIVCETRSGPDALMLSLDSSAVGHFKSLVSGRLAHGRSFKFQSSDGTVTFRPSKTQANQVKYLEGGKLEIELSLQAAQALCRRVSPKPYHLFDLPELNHLKIQVEPLEADARRVAVLSQAEWEQQNFGQGGFDQPDESDAALTIHAWKVLESELKRHLPYIYQQLDQGASDEDLTRLEQQLGFPIPQDLKAFYRRHDGFKNPISNLPDGALNCELSSRVMFSYELLPICRQIQVHSKLESVLERVQKWSQLPKTVGQESRTGRGISIGPCRFMTHNPRWIPLCSNGDLDMICYDADPAPGGRFGQILVASHTQQMASVIADSLADFLHAQTAYLKVGMVKWEPKLEKPVAAIDQSPRVVVEPVMAESPKSAVSYPPLTLPIQVHLVVNPVYACSWSIQKTEDFFNEVNTIFAQAGIKFEPDIRQSPVPTASLEAAFDHNEQDEPKGKRKSTVLPLKAVENYEPSRLNLFLLDACIELSSKDRVPGVNYRTISLLSLYARDKFFRNHCIRLSQLLDLKLDKSIPSSCLMNFNGEGTELRQSEIETMRARLVQLQETLGRQPQLPPAGNLSELRLPIKAHLVSNPDYACSWSSAGLQRFFDEINAIFAQANLKVEPQIVTSEIDSAALEMAFRREDQSQPPASPLGLKNLASFQPGMVNLYFLDYCPVIGSSSASAGESFRRDGMAMVSLWEREMRSQALKIALLLNVPYPKDPAEPRLMSYKNSGALLLSEEIERLREGAKVWTPADPASTPQYSELRLPIRIHLVDNPKYPCSWGEEQAKSFIAEANRVFKPAGLTFEGQIFHTSLTTESLEAAFYDREPGATKDRNPSSVVALQASENHDVRTLNLYFLDGSVNLVASRPMDGVSYPAANFGIWSSAPNQEIRRHLIRLGLILKLSIDNQAPDQCLMNWNSTGFDLRSSEQETVRSAVSYKLKTLEASTFHPLGWLVKSLNEEDLAGHLPKSTLEPELRLPIRVHLVANPQYSCSWDSEQVNYLMTAVNRVFRQAGIVFVAEIYQTAIVTESLEAAFNDKEPGADKDRRPIKFGPLKESENYDGRTLNLYLLDSSLNLVAGNVVDSICSSASNLALLSLAPRGNFLRDSCCIRFGQLLTLKLNSQATPEFLMNWNQKGFVLRPDEQELARTKVREKLQALKATPDKANDSLTEIKEELKDIQASQTWLASNPEYSALKLTFRVHLVQNQKYPCSWGPEQVQSFMAEVNQVFKPTNVSFDATIVQTKISNDDLEAAFYHYAPGASEPVRHSNGQGIKSSENYDPLTLNLYFLDASVNLDAKRSIDGNPFQELAIALLSTAPGPELVRRHCVRIGMLLKLSVDAKAPADCLMSWTTKGLKLRPQEQDLLRSSVSALLKAAQSAPKPIPPETLEEILAELDGLVGRQEMKQELRRLANRLKLEARRRQGQAGPDDEALLVNLLISGNPGVGRTTAARFLGRILKAVGGLSGGHLVELDRSVHRTSEAIGKEVDRALGGVLLVNDTEHFIQSSQDTTGKAGAITLLGRLRRDKDKFACVFAGEPGGLEEFVKAQGFESHFRHHITLKDFSAEELAELFKRFAEHRRLQLLPEAAQELRALMQTVIKQKGASFGNIRVVRDLLDKAIEQQADRLGLLDDVADEDLFSLVADDIPGRSERLWNTKNSKSGTTVSDPPESDSLEAILAELDQLVGLSKVKAKIHELVSFFKVEKMRQKEGQAHTPISLHMLFAGAPGTGKTTVARLMGRLLKALEFLGRGQLVETDRSGLVGPYLGQTAPKTNAIVDEAIGGVLFVDEAYSLKNREDDSYGMEAINTLLKRMEDSSHELSVVVAGYTSEMKKFLSSNPGLQSRVQHRLEFEDYTHSELLGIFQQMCKKRGFSLEPEAEERAKQVLSKVTGPEMSSFGNGRGVRNFFEQCLQRQSVRLSQLEPATSEGLFRLVAQDIPETTVVRYGNHQGQSGTRISDPPESDSLQAVLAEVDQMVGLPKVKAKIHQLVSYFKVEKMRQKQGQAQTPISMHMLFAGAPGTGKTTVARLMGRLLKSLEFLGRGHLVETDRSGLVGSHLGQTAPKTNAIIDEAIGGVLFVDEAYALKTRDDDSFGMEAINTLLKRMEDSSQHLGVVVAGYTSEMNRFLNSNPGMQSRVQHRLEFEDYRPSELLSIFLQMCQQRGFKLDVAAQERVQEELAQVVGPLAAAFGNGRGVRNFFEHCLERQAARLNQPEMGEGNLNTLLAADIKMHPWGDGIRRADSLERVLADVDGLVGLPQVKEKIHQLVALFKLEKLRRREGQVKRLTTPHLTFIGGPGTGKTMVLDLLARLFYFLEISHRDQSTEHKDPIIIVTVLRDPNSLSADGVARMAATMDSSQSPTSVVVVGDKQEIGTFLESNPSLQSKLHHRLEFPDYSSEQLLSIFQHVCKQRGFSLNSEAEERAKQVLSKISGSVLSGFGNGRGVRNFFEECLQRQSTRLSQLDSATDQQLFSLEATDIPERVVVLYNNPQGKSGTRISDPPESDSLEAVLGEVDRLVGLPKVKEKIHQLVNFFKVEQLRQKEGLAATKPSLHMVFSGAPGTGKTTVARLIGRLLRALELLARGQLVETDRSGLVAQYLGQTAVKTNAIIDQAMDGVLFVDEAYGLVDEDDKFGHEAVNTLIKRMEDSNQRLSVVLAGYSQEMAEFLKTNPGLESRLPHRLDFEDYKAEELASIFVQMAQDRGFALEPAAEQRVQEELLKLSGPRKSNFGNGRGVRNFFEHCLELQASRLAAGEMLEGNLNTLTAQDIEIHSGSKSDKERLGFRKSWT